MSATRAAFAVVVVLVILAFAAVAWHPTALGAAALGAAALGAAALGAAATGRGATGGAVDLADFSQVGATRYSAPRPDHAEQEVCFFRRLDPEGKFERVVDATAHVGVDTHVLAKAFACRVDAVEYVPETFRALERNIKKFAVPGVRAVHASAPVFIAGLAAEAADLVYFDPPWGGPGYQQMDDLPLYDAGGSRTVSLAPVVDDALRVAPVVVLKVPHNFEYKKFERRIAGHVVNVSRVKYTRGRRGKRAVFLLLEIRRAALAC